MVSSQPLLSLCPVMSSLRGVAKWPPLGPGLASGSLPSCTLGHLSPPPQPLGSATGVVLLGSAVVSLLTDDGAQEVADVPD